MSATLIMTAKTGRADADVSELHFVSPCWPRRPPLPPPRRPPPPSPSAPLVTLTPVASSFSRLVASVSVPFRPSTTSQRSPWRTPSVTDLLRDLAVLHDVDRRDAGQRRDRRVRHRQHALVLLREDDALGEEARLEPQVRVVDQRFDRERPHRLVERRADVRDLALEHRVAEGLDAELDRLARLDDAGVSFLDAGPQLQRIDLDDRRDRRALGDVFADVHRALRDDAGDRARAPRRRRAS